MEIDALHAKIDLEIIEIKDIINVSDQLDPLIRFLVEKSMKPSASNSNVECTLARA